MKNKIKIISLFAWAWWLDLWFNKAWFETIWANEYDKTIWPTFEYNFPKIVLEKKSIINVEISEIPDSIGIIGGPPCQSWSEAGSGRGINDKRWQLFYEYIRILKAKKPLFFLAENVPWILHSKHKSAFESILENFREIWYNVSYFLLNSNDFGVAQDRNRVIIVWYDKKMWKFFEPPKNEDYKPVLKDVILDLWEPLPAKERNYANEPNDLNFVNHEYMIWWFSTMFMFRNRVRSWDEPSFTIQAGWRHAPIHPNAPKMIYIWENKRIFEPWKEDLYRRLSVRECARIQSFPDDFIFKYEKIADWYKMIWNAVPVEFAKKIAKKIYEDIKEFTKK